MTNAKQGIASTEYADMRDNAPPLPPSAPEGLRVAQKDLRYANECKHKAWQCVDQAWEGLNKANEDLARAKQDLRCAETRYDDANNNVQSFVDAMANARDRYDENEHNEAVRLRDRARRNVDIARRDVDIANVTVRLALQQIEHLQDQMKHLQQINATEDNFSRRDKTAVVDKPNHSASEIARNYAELYDPYAAAICAPESYVPNHRLQQLISEECDARQMASFQCKMMLELPFVESFRAIRDSGETKLEDRNLQKLLQIMERFSDGFTCDKVEFDPSQAHLSNSIHPEHCLLLEDRIAIGCDVKGIEASIRMCYPQLIALCGSLCLELSRRLPIEDCVVLGIAMAGSNVQFCAVYLIEDTFPVFVTLSPELSFLGSERSKADISRWCLRCLSFAQKTQELLDSSRIRSSQNVCVRLNLWNYFAKPVRTYFPKLNNIYEPEDGTASYRIIALNRLLYIYERLRTEGGSDVHELVLFPAGTVSIPSEENELQENLRKLLVEECEENGFQRHVVESCPVLLFPRLEEEAGWTTEKPPIHMRDQYLKQLRRVVDALNTAGIAHLDLRPPNIMWREECGEVSLRLIDFDDAVNFHHVIPQEYVNAMAIDCRYPFDLEDIDVEHVALEEHNEFFYRAVQDWVNFEE